jgi:hypothetical protein
MKKILISTAIIGVLSIAPLAFAQSTVTGTLSSGGTTSTSTGSTSLSGSVGSGNSLTGTVTSPSTGGGGGSSGGGGNGPPVGGGGGGGSDTTIICPNLPNSLFTLPAGYQIVNGNCDPVGAVLGASTGPTTGTSVPGIPNTGAGGNAEENDLVLLASGLLGTFASVALLRKYFVRQ